LQEAAYHLKNGAKVAHFGALGLTFIAKPEPAGKDFSPPVFV
jgi:hypothetical protein